MRSNMSSTLFVFAKGRCAASEEKDRRESPTAATDSVMAAMGGCKGGKIAPATFMWW